MKNLYFTFLLLFFLPAFGFSQVAISVDTTSGPQIILEKERAFSIFAHNRGLGLGMCFGKRINVKRSSLYSIQVTNLRSLSQVRLHNPFYRGAKSNFLGKLNYVYVGRFGKMYSLRLTPKPYWNGVRLNLKYAFGFSLFIIKPYYIEEIKVDQDGSFYLNSERYDPSIHNENNIYGRASFFEGFGNLKTNIGAFVKTGLEFEFGKSNEKIRSLEFGFILEGTPFGIDFTAEKGKEYFIPTLYISLSFGKRYNTYYSEEKKKLQKMEFKDVQ
ncbi:MAG: hypothetical protein ACEPOW_04765 [Bacteroidales bacterium]